MLLEFEVVIQSPKVEELVREDTRSSLTADAELPDEAEMESFGRGKKIVMGDFGSDEDVKEAGFEPDIDVALVGDV